MAVSAFHNKKELPVMILAIKHISLNLAVNSSCHSMTCNRHAIQLQHSQINECTKDPQYIILIVWAVRRLLYKGHLTKMWNESNYE